MKVLAVDDSTSILELIKTVLTAEGIEVETATNGAEALYKYAKIKPDVVTLDVSMPVMDGIETLAKLLKLDKDAKIIMLTVQEHWQVVERCLEHGAIGYLAKPFRVNDLVDTIKDPWHYDDKNIITLFSIACNRISAALQKLFSMNVSVKLNHIEMIEEASSTYKLSANDVSQIVVVPKTVKELEVVVPQGSMGFVTEFGGQGCGMIMSLIRNEDADRFATMSASYFGPSANKEDVVKEISSTIHGKIFSTLVEITKLILTSEETTAYDETKHRKPANNLVKTILQINAKEVLVPVEVQFWINLSQLFSRRM